VTPVNPQKPLSTKNNSIPVVKRSKSGIDAVVYSQVRTPRENNSVVNGKAEEVSLTEQLKRLKMVNNVLKQEHSKQCATISRLENKVNKLTTNKFN